VTNWFGLLAPGKTPQSIVTRINRDTVQHLQAADFNARLIAEGAEPVGGSPADFGKLVREDIAKYARIVKAAGIKVE